MEEYNEFNGSTELEIINVLDKIRPFIQRDGGDVRLVKYEDGIVYLKIYGACVGCVALELDLKEGIESILKEEIPAVVEVRNVDAEALMENDIENN